MDQRFFYNGKTLTLYNPTEKVYAAKEAPDTIERMIDFARETVGILLPRPTCSTAMPFRC